MGKKLGWGILGTGNIAGTLAAAIKASNTGELVGVGSRTKESADRFGDKWEVPRRFATYEELLACDEVDAIYISLPNHLHAEWAIRCAAAKKHILCEKPLAMNYGEAMAVIEAAQYHDVFFMEAFMYRCSQQTHKLVEIIRGGAIGQVRIIQANFSYNMGPKYDNIRLINEAGGGALMDVGCYCMSMARLVAGAAHGKEAVDPIEISGLAHIGETSRCDEWTVASARFPGDILATLTCGNEVNVDSTTRIWGSDGHILVPNPWFPGGKAGDKSQIIVNRAGSEETIEVEAYAGLYSNEVDTVAKFISRREAPSPSMTYADSLGNQRALDEWRRQVGLAFDGENTTALTHTVSRRPLVRRAGARMTYGEIEGVGKPVSRLVIGTMVVTDSRLPFSFSLLDNFVENGGTAIDTAHVYQGGHSETAVGKWINTRGIRDRIVLIAKGGASIEVTPDWIERELNTTMDRLAQDYVDIYMMHRDNTQVPVGEFVDCLNRLREAGRLRAFGGSNWTTARLEEANEYARSKGVPGFACSSPNLSLAVWNEPMWANCVAASDPESKAWYAKTRLPLLAWSSQASGLFTGRYSPADADNPAAAEVARVWFNEPNWKRLERAQEVAKTHGVTALQVALAYVLCQPVNVFALIGPQNLEETRTSLKALEVTLTPDEMRYLNLE